MFSFTVEITVKPDRREHKRSEVIARSLGELFWGAAVFIDHRLNNWFFSFDRSQMDKQNIYNQRIFNH